MNNERFPHTLKVLRARIDAAGHPVYTIEGIPIYSPVVLALVSTLAGEPIKRNGAYVTTSVTTINFGYRTATLNSSTMGDVVTSDFKIATPMFITPLETGDILELTDSDRTYRGKVIKKATFNWGSNIWFDEIKN